MFGTLLESRTKRRRRLGGAAVSVAAHLTIIGAITATTVHGRTTKLERPESVLIRFRHPTPPPPRPVDQPVPRTTIARTASFSPVTIHHIEAPRTIPIDLPTIDSSLGAASDSIVIGHGPSSSPLARSIIGDDNRNGSNEWRGAELQTRIVTSARLRYPESLRQAAIDGTVLVRFAIDTTGRIDMGSVTIVSSTHELFTRAVRDALQGFRFKPAEMGGHRVRALAEMPFEFQITR
jgi:protein TonB